MHRLACGLHAPLTTRLRESHRSRQSAVAVVAQEGSRGPPRAAKDALKVDHKVEKGCVWGGAYRPAHPPPWGHVLYLPHVGVMSSTACWVMSSTACSVLHLPIFHHMDSCGSLLLPTMHFLPAAMHCANCSQEYNNIHPHTANSPRPSLPCTPFPTPYSPPSLTL